MGVFAFFNMGEFTYMSSENDTLWLEAGIKIRKSTKCFLQYCIHEINNVTKEGT
jgi:hypothetical protein